MLDALGLYFRRDGSLMDVGLRDDSGTVVDVKGVEIMQFTGLLDKNGKEIYEGDIVRIFHRKWYLNAPTEWKVFKLKSGKEQLGAVYFDENDYRYRAKCLENFSPVFDNCGEHGTRHFEVIGNIYENPELLKST